MEKQKDIKQLLYELLPEQVSLLKQYLTGVEMVIDIGTGSSIPIHFFSRHFPGIRFMTADITDMRQEKDLPFVLFDGKKLPFPDKSFDIAVLNEVLHHAEEPESVLLEAKRVGVVVFIVEHFPSANIPPDRLWKEESEALRALGLECTVYKPFTRSSLLRLFDRTGLRIEERLKLPYHGKREIEKYFFKLEGK